MQIGDLAVDRSVRKALSSESRVAILKSVSVRRRTQSELARELTLSSPTILQHLSVLLESGLIERIDEGRKWKYYQLTEKGRALLGVERRAVPVRSIILFAIAIIFITSSVYMLQLPYNQEEGDTIVAKSAVTEDNLQPIAPNLLAVPAESAAQLTAQPGSNNQLIYYAMLVFGVLSLIMAIYIYWQNRQKG